MIVAYLSVTSLYCIERDKENSGGGNFICSDSVLSDSVYCTVAKRSGCTESGAWYIGRTVIKEIIYKTSV